MGQWGYSKQNSYKLTVNSILRYFLSQAVGAVKEHSSGARRVFYWYDSHLYGENKSFGFYWENGHAGKLLAALVSPVDELGGFRPYEAEADMQAGRPISRRAVRPSARRPEEPRAPYVWGPAPRGGGPET